MAAWRGMVVEEWPQGAQLWSHDLAWSLIRWTVLFVLSYGQSSSLALGNLSLFPLVLRVSSLPHGKIFSFSPGCARVTGSSNKVTKLIQSHCISCHVAQGALGGPVDQIPSLLSSQNLVFWFYYILHTS